MAFMSFSEAHESSLKSSVYQMGFRKSAQIEQNCLKQLYCKLLSSVVTSWLHVNKTSLQHHRPNCHFD